MSWEVMLAGLVIGTMIGLTGMGGGSLITPAMIFLFRVQPLVAVGTDLVLGALTKTVGAVAHYRLGNVNLKITKVLLTGSIPGALLGLTVLWILPSLHFVAADTFIKHALGVVLLLVSIGMFFPSAWTIAERFKSQSEMPRHVWAFRGVSFGVGFVVSITSVGSGSLLVPFLLASITLPLTRIIGTDVLHGAILTLVAGAAHLASGNVNAPLLLNLLAGSVPGVVLGSKLAVAFPKRGVEIVLGVVLAVSGIKLL